jgi:integrin beta 8
MPEDEYGAYDYHEQNKDNSNVPAQSESPSLSSDLQPQREETTDLAPILKPEEETPPYEASTNTPEIVTSDFGEVNLMPEITDQGIPESPAEEELCSRNPFDAFTDLKNGSLFAFRGDSRGRSWELGVVPSVLFLTQPPPLLGQYCYELDEASVRPGYPKLIRDVWGIEGPIDAAFTRINCQGKTYLFKVSDPGAVDQGGGH